jgi:hypothetical protein
MTGKLMMTLTLGSLVLFVGCGSPPEYSANSIIMLSFAPDLLHEDTPVIDVGAEIARIETLGASVITDETQQLRVVEQAPNLIIVSVIGSDPQKAADVCNRIVERYISAEVEGLKKTQLDKALPPKVPAN